MDATTTDHPEGDDAPHRCHALSPHADTCRQRLRILSREEAKQRRTG